jgi:hypothetical protein
LGEEGFGAGEVGRYSLGRAGHGKYPVSGKIPDGVSDKEKQNLMAVLKRKSRMISLRLSDDEYEALRSLYRLHGSRSVSEFARNAMQKVIGENVPLAGSTLETRIVDLDAKMASLDHEVARLVQLIEARLEPASRNAAALAVDAA